MISSIFGDLQFDTGWKTQIDLLLFGKTYKITLKARAYEEAEGLTAEQQQALSDFHEHLAERQKDLENLLNAYAEGAEGDAISRFLPRTILFAKEGGYALLCDDFLDPDGGIAVALAPQKEVIAQDDYL